MNKLKELFQQHELSTTSDYLQSVPLNLAEVKLVYPDVKTYSNWNNQPPTSGYLECKKKGKCESNHWFEHLVDGTWRYSWPGNYRLISKKIIPIDVLHEVLALKEGELAAARKKRFETIKSARDAVRVTFRDLEIKHDLVNGDPRVDLGPLVLEFAGAKDSPKVEVSFTYKTGYNGYLQKETLIELTVADPTFNQKVQAIVNNGKNLKKLMLGEAQPENVSNAK